MTQPAAYTPQYDHSEELTTTQVPGNHGAHLDVEFAALEVTTDAIRDNLAVIQRDDTALKNAIVTPDSLSAGTKLLIGAGSTDNLNWTPRGLWATATAYAIGDVVETGGASYVAAVAHTSGTFVTDHTAGKWVVIDSNVRRTVATLSTLKALTGMSTNDHVIVLGYNTVSDGGGGEFRWDGTSSATANNGTIVAADVGGTGRWFRVWDGVEIEVARFGAFPSATAATNTAAIIAALAAAPLVLPGSGTYDFDAVIDVGSSALVGRGATRTILRYTGAAVNGPKVKCASASGGAVENLKIDCRGSIVGSGGSIDIGISVQGSAANIAVRNVWVVDAVRHALAAPNVDTLTIQNFKATGGCASSAVLIGQFPLSYGLPTNVDCKHVTIEGMHIEDVDSDGLGVWNCSGNDGFTSVCYDVKTTGLTVKKFGQTGLGYAYWGSGITTTTNDVHLNGFYIDNADGGTSNEGRGLHIENGFRWTHNGGSITNLITGVADTTLGYGITLGGGTELEYSNIALDAVGIGVLANNSSEVNVSNVHVKNPRYQCFYIGGRNLRFSNCSGTQSGAVATTNAAWGFNAPRVTFTSGGAYEVLPGDTIVGATSGATAVVERVVLASGAWGAGTAAGTFTYADYTGGAFVDENINVGANLNVATVTATPLLAIDGITLEQCHGTVTSPVDANDAYGFEIVGPNLAGNGISLGELSSDNTYGFKVGADGLNAPFIHGTPVSVRVKESVAAGTDYEVPITHGPQKVGNRIFIIKAKLGFDAGIVVDATDKNVYKLNRRDSAGINTTPLTTVGLRTATESFATAYVPVNFTIDAPLVGHLRAGEILTIAKTHSNAGKAETNGLLTYEYVTY